MKMGYKPYFGPSKSHSEEIEAYFCNKTCKNQWYSNLVWHLDVIDERMNSNIYFQRTEGMKGTYKGKPVHATWNGLEARYFLGEYEFQHRKPHPETCDGCDLMQGSLQL